MTLANVFYTMGIIFMSLTFIIMVILVVGVFYIKRKIDLIHRTVERKIESVMGPAETAISAVRRIMSKKRS
jgi:uncharacterized membrane protein